VIGSPTPLSRYYYVTYEDYQSIQYKLKLIIDNKYGGISFSSLTDGCDDLMNVVMSIFPITGYSPPHITHSFGYPSPTQSRISPSNYSNNNNSSSSPVLRNIIIAIVVIIGVICVCVCFFRCFNNKSGSSSNVGGGSVVRRREPVSRTEVSEVFYSIETWRDKYGNTVTRTLYAEKK